MTNWPAATEAARLADMRLVNDNIIVITRAVRIDLTERLKIDNPDKVRVHFGFCSLSIKVRTEMHVRREAVCVG